MTSHWCDIHLYFDSVRVSNGIIYFKENVGYLVIEIPPHLKKKNLLEMKRAFFSGVFGLYFMPSDF